ncbi:hypothetical protein [Glacieibacterium sp.]|uniref:hypothetical protein n=1 Tax=Glacieibacterium sp. TaxID=2860237 RepID=UPI003B00B7C4
MFVAREAMFWLRRDALAVVSDAGQIMEERTFGTAGLKASALGFGGMSFASVGFAVHGERLPGAASPMTRL